MLYRFEKNIIYKLFIIVLIIISTGCVTGKRSANKINPLDIIPKDFSVYVKTKNDAQNIPVIKEKIEKLTLEMGVPKFLKDRTNDITFVLLNDDWSYIAAQGSYPDTFIKERLTQDDEWTENSYQRIKYFFSDSKKIILVLLNNIIIASDFSQETEPNSATGRAKKIIDIIMSNDTVSDSSVSDSVLRIISNSPSGVFTQFVNENISLNSIKEVNIDVILDPKKKKSGGINISFLAEDEKKAILFTSVIRLFISDYVVKKKITDVKTLKENDSILHNGDFIYVTINDIPLEKLNTFIADFIIYH